MTRNKEKIVICGHYGASNIGDEAILQAMVQNLKEIKPDAELTVLGHNPQNIKEIHGIDANYLIPMGLRSLFRGIFKGELWRTLRIIKNSDKFILGGGGLFTDEKIFAIFLWGIHAFFALKYKKPLYMLGQSIGPLRSKIGKWIVKKAFIKAKLIYVRDSASKELLEKLGINQEIHVAPDLVFSLNLHESNKDQELFKKIEQEGLRGYFCVNLRDWSKEMDLLYKNIEQVVSTIVEKYRLLPVLIPFQIIDQDDSALLRKLVAQNNPKYPLLIQKFEQNPKKLLSLISGAKINLGMRLHFNIFSIITRTPFLALSYSPKIDNLLKDLKLNDYLAKDFNKGALLKQIDQIIDKELPQVENSRNAILSIFRKI